jgi:D-tyrosyl-tRNA(Tyr) deacylase
MKAVIQRVSEARVDVAGTTVGSISRGIMVLLGVQKGDGERDAERLVDKIVRLRLFEDDAGKMNLALGDVGGALLVVSQFTLVGNCAKGRRPSFDDAAPPGEAKRLYEHFVEIARKCGVTVETGTFQAMMQVSLTNDGPVTFILNSCEK